MNLLGAPNSWGDGLEWELDTKPTGRHFQAIFLAIGERTFAKNTTYFDYHLLDIYRINWGASAYSAKDIENLNKLIYEINIFFRDREPIYTAGCFGKGRLEFDLGFNGFSSLRWYDDTNEDAPDSFYNKLIRNYQTKKISISAGVIDYGGVLETMVNRCPMVMKCDKMSVANRKIMAWLIDLKNALNRMHTIFVSCGLGYPVKVDGITDTYYEAYRYYKDDDRDVSEDYWETGREQNMTDADLNIIEGRVSNYTYKKQVSKDYWASVRMPPISIQNQLPFSYKASLHISGYCRQGHYVSETEYYAIEPIGEYIKKIGWNEIGTLNPTEEKQILDASFCYDGNGARDYWNKYGNRDDCDINFKVNIDCIRLDFRVDGGFQFYTPYVEEEKEETPTE